MVTQGQIKKKNFVNFKKSEAFKLLGLTDLLPWSVAAVLTAPSAFFQDLQRHFDLESGEEAKKLLIDAICDEALEGIEHIKVWKAASLEGETKIVQISVSISS
ncbi:MAG: hypothetical protein AAGE59_15495 [Cyanobacteria bacterium P01_F01_bin.86]